MEIPGFQGSNLSHFSQLIIFDLSPYHWVGFSGYSVCCTEFPPKLRLSIWLRDSKCWLQLEFCTIPYVLSQAVLESVFDILSFASDMINKFELTVRSHHSFNTHSYQRVVHHTSALDTAVWLVTTATSIIAEWSIMSDCKNLLMIWPCLLCKAFGMSV